MFENLRESGIDEHFTRVRVIGVVRDLNPADVLASPVHVTLVCRVDHGRLNDHVRVLWIRVRGEFGLGKNANLVFSLGGVILVKPDTVRGIVRGGKY